ncbi:hypothetical protein Cni_G26350 [Canna indica]|uniref:Protein DETOXIFICATION n=1 Tax=Canna indica TaxID=4628 RepID=A0AAQ3L219_9LILI|nr:hypothetical protein Cni_G26350 [Canna indica]
MDEALLQVENEREGEVVASEHGWWGGAGGELIGELRLLSNLAAPMVAVLASQFLVTVISTMMVGHLGELDLAGAAIASSLTAVTGFSLLSGMASGLETLCGQAYGAKEFHMVGIHMYRAILSLLLVCIPVSVLWIYMRQVLQLVGQDPLVSQEAGRYTLWLIPALLAHGIGQCLMKLLLAQSLILPMLLSSAATLCIHVPLCWAMVFKSGLRNVGAALSIGISYWLNVFMLGMYIRYSPKCKDCRAPISKEAFKGIGEFMKLALPSASMLCLEWWSFELLILLSGFLPNSQLETSVLSICRYTCEMLCQIMLILNLFNCWSSTRVSNELGAWQPKGAIVAVKATIMIAVCEAVLVCGTLFAARERLGYAFSYEEEVVSYVTEMVPLICCSVFFESLLGVLSGISRGAGWQDLGAYVNLGSLYLVGIPIAVVLGFLMHVGGKGLWIGIVSGAATQTLLLALITCFTNWDRQAAIARERILREKLPLQDALEYAGTTDGKQTEKYILNTRFWDCVAEIVVALEPLYKVLRQYRYDLGTMDSLLYPLRKVIQRMSASTREAAQALNELRYFRDSSGNFGDPFAISCRDSMDPVEWWLQFGTETPTFRKIATCILSQTTSSSGYERNCSTFALIHTKPHNRLSYARLEKLVYIHYNMQLRMRTLQNEDIQHVDPFDVEFVQDDADPIFDWWSAMESDQPLLDEPGEPPRPSPIISDALES